MCEELIEDGHIVDDHCTIGASDNDNTANYTIVSIDGGVSVINLETNESSTLTYADDGCLTLEMVELDQNDNFIKNSVTVSFPEEDVLEGQGYKSVVKETYKNKYWYQESSTGKYVRVGCDAKYRINYDALSNSKAKKVDKYMTKVRTTKKKWNEFKRLCALENVSVGAMVGAIAAAIAMAPETGGASVIAGIIAGFFVGITVSEALEIYNNYSGAVSAFNTAKSTYTTIKAYGTKF